MVGAVYLVLFALQGPVVTDNGNLILDWKFEANPVQLILNSDPSLASSPILT